MCSEGEWRKLGNNFSKWERLRIENIIKSSNFKYNTYSNYRLKERNISELDVLRAIKYGNIIEFHYKYGNPRVLIRGKEIVNGESICVVLNLRYKSIVTVYSNDCTDAHFSLHKEIYNNGIDLMKYLNVQ